MRWTKQTCNLPQEIIVRQKKMLSFTTAKMTILCTTKYIPSSYLAHGDSESSDSNLQLVQTD